MEPYYFEKSSDNNITLYGESGLNDRLEKFLSDLNDNILKCKYRKSLEEIKSKESVYNECRQCWKITEIKIKCMLCIINKKFSKYSGSKIKGLEGWLNRVDKEVEKWFDVLAKFEKNDSTPREDNFFEQVEICIYIVLEQCYNYALYSRNEKEMADCAGFLALGERLLKYASEFTNSPDSLQTSQKILLFTSSLLIADNDFETAKTYQNTALKFAYKELQLRVDNEDQLNLKEASKSELVYIEKIFLNMVIAFYQMGVCEENLGDLTKAIEAYKQSKWFSLNFIKHSIPILSQFIFDIEKRALNYHNLIQNVKRNEAIHIEINNNKKNTGPKVYYNELEILNRFEKTKAYLENLKMPEIEDDDVIFEKKSPKIKNILSTVKMVNNLMSDKFHNIVMGMDKVNVTKIDKETMSKIQKKLVEIKNDEKFSTRREKKNTQNTENNSYNTNLTQSKSPQKNNNNKNKNKTSPLFVNDKNIFTFTSQANMLNNNKEKYHNKNKTQNNFTMSKTNGDNSMSPSKFFQYNTEITQPSSNINLYKNKDLKNISLKSGPFKYMNTYSSKFKSNVIPNIKDDVEKFEYSEYVFKKSYRKKINFLDKVAQREYGFQKQLLNLKKCEKIIVDEFRKEKVMEDCELFINKALKSKIRVLKEDDNANKKREILNESGIKNERQKEKYETKVIKSLTNKAYGDLVKFTRELQSPKFTLRKEFIDESSKIIPDGSKIFQMNKDAISKIQIELELLRKKEKICMANMNQRPFSTRNYRRLDTFGNRRSMEDFISGVGETSKRKNLL